MDFFADLYKLAASQLDILLILAIVLLVQLAKKQLPKLNKKWWTLVMIALGFLVAWITVPTVVGHGKEYLRKALIYAAGAEFTYQMWKTISTTLVERIRGPKK